MINLPKVVEVVQPQAIVDDTSWVATAVDCKGFDYARINIQFGAMDVAMAALSLAESADGTATTAITGANFSGGTLVDGTTGALPPATADNRIYSFLVDCKYRKRFLHLVATGGNGTSGSFMSATAELFRAGQEPNTMAERGAFAEIAV